MITAQHQQQYVDEGYFILERAIPDEHLQILRDSCDHLIDLMHQEMDRLGTDHIHISHRGKRYHIAKKFEQAPGLSKYVFSDLMADVCRATIGDTAFLFYDQYVAKAAEQGIQFSWHQDSGYLGFPHRPYVTVWAAVDDMTLENGTAFVMPYSTIGVKTLVEHIRDRSRWQSGRLQLADVPSEWSQHHRQNATSVCDPVFSGVDLRAGLGPVDAPGRTVSRTRPETA